MFILSIFNVQECLISKLTINFVEDWTMFCLEVRLEVGSSPPWHNVTTVVALAAVNHLLGGGVSHLGWLVFCMNTGGIDLGPLGLGLSFPNPLTHRWRYGSLYKQILSP